MSKLKLIKVGGITRPTEFTENGGALSVTVEGAASGARLSLGAVFAALTDGHAKIEPREIPAGEYTLFLHEGNESTPVAKIGYAAGIFTLKLGTADLLALANEVQLARARLADYGARIAALEKMVFAPVIF